MHLIAPVDARHQAYADALAQHLPAKQIYTDPISRYAYGTDASFYRYVPQVAVRAHHEAEVSLCMALAKQHRVAVTFRTSGSSLSGQACTESVLVMLGDGFLTQEVLEDGLKVKLGPMVIGATANVTLAPYQRKIGPDPASINTARIGGIVANNSSGMCCGTKENTYRTLDSMRLVLADGTVLNTADPTSVAAFRHSHAKLLSQLQALSTRVRQDDAMMQRIHKKYQMKNTTGYSVNALVDFDDPLDMLWHLIIGSEGTLAFVSEVIYRTVPDYPDKASAFVFFESLEACCLAVTALRQRATVDAVELLDALSIRRTGQEKTGLPAFFYADFSDDAACLLIETKAPSADLLTQQIKAIDQLLAEFGPAAHTGFQLDHGVSDQFWAVRKGLMPISAANRPKGTSFITEDVVLPIERLAEGVRRLGRLFQDYDYHDAMIMGHALEGNLHFILTPNMDDPQEIQRFDGFMQDLAQIVAIDYGGSLKGEHGTGRNIAPFVCTEWGDDIYAIMCAIKALFDPDRILNPEVLINANERLHVTSLKNMPVSDPIVDDCIECGFCESACPSNGYTLTPRQRITTHRYLSALKRNPNTAPEVLAEYQASYALKGIQSCAETGMCATRCPIGIDTGSLMRQLRLAAPHPRRLAQAQKQLGPLSVLARLSMKTSHGLGLPMANRVSKTLHRRYPTLPIVPLSLPKASPKLPESTPNKGKPVVYFVSCVNRVMAEVADGQHTASHTLSLFQKAGFNALYPPQLQQLCCGQPFASAKADSVADAAANTLNAALLQASNQGQHPVYLDNGPCALRIKDAQRQGLIDKRLTLYDAAEFLSQHVLPHLTIHQTVPSLALHVPCSASKMQASASLKQLAQACTDQLSVPDIACCGFAGLKGFTQPELNANGLRNLPKLLPADCAHGVSMSKTCQVGLTSHSGLPYHSIEALLDQCSRAS
ncbi:MAG: FAD-binding oxidoreductase [Neisseriaceae bacterium]|nr:FAD-binding oxidoreductase [Neisseriaceae bacterium]